MWTFELYRMLAAQRMAEALREAEQLRRASEAAGRALGPAAAGYPPAAEPVRPGAKAGHVRGPGATGGVMVANR